jgi:hypothetical protein
MRQNNWSVTTARHLSTIRYKFASRLPDSERHEELSTSEFNSRLYNLSSELGLTASNGLGMVLPKKVVALETDEIVDGKLANNLDAVHTSGRKQERIRKEKHAKELKAKRRIAAKKAVVTRRYNLEKAALAAADAAADEARRVAMHRIMHEVCFLQEEDMPREEMFT